MGRIEKESAEKMEFRMLAARAKELGKWSQAEIGRRLKVERATVNGIVTGDKEPGAPLLELFRFVFFQAFPGAQIHQAKYPEAPGEMLILAESAEEVETIKKLREVHSADLDAFNTIGHVVDLAHRHLPKKKISSIESAAAAVVKGQVAEVRKQLKNQSHSAATGRPAPSASKDESSPQGSSRSSAPPNKEAR